MTRNYNLIDTKFPALPTRNNQAFPIDVSACSIFDINIDENGQSIVNTRKIPRNRETCLTPKGLALPLTLPKFDYCSPYHHVKRTLRYPNQQVDTVDVRNQYRWYSQMRRDLHYNGLKDALGAGSKDWRHVKKLIRSNPISELDFNNIASKKKRRNFQHILRRQAVVCEHFDDIPKKLVCSLLEDACYADYKDYTINRSLRNCVAAYGSDHVLYATGPYNNKLVLVKLTADRELLSSIECDHADITERVMEIQCFDDLVNVRGLYSTTHFRIVSSDDHFKLKELKRLTFDTNIHACAMNLFTRDEIVTLDDANVVVVSLDGRILHSMAHEMNGDEDVDWLNVIYGSSIQQCLVSKKSEILIHDFRENPYTQRQFFDLPSEYFNRYERFSPVLTKSLMSHHQYLAATNQAVVLIDERYLKTPVMKINHYMDSPPRYVQTYMNKGDGDFGCCIALGNYETKEIIGMNLRNGREQELSLGQDARLKCKSPMQMDGNIVKFSSSDDWCSNITDWRLPYRTIKNRVEEPVIGFCINNHSSTTKGELILTQETLAGDLFYQKFTNEQAYDTESKNRNRLDTDSESWCKLWIDGCWELKQNNEEKTDSDLHKCFNVDVLVKKLSKVFHQNENNKNLVTPLKEGDRVPVKENTDHETDSDMDVDLFDDYNKQENVTELKKVESSCESERNDIELLKNREFWTSMKAIRDLNQIVTRTSLSLSTSTSNEQLELVSNLEEFTKPLSRTLLVNWNGDEYTPLEEFATNLKIVDQETVNSDDDADDNVDTSIKVEE